MKSTVKPFSPTSVGNVEHVENIESIKYEAAAPGVAWSAIFAGTLTVAIASLLMLLLGSGLGLASISPWVYSGISATTFTVSAIVWLVLTQFVASGLGGYMAGRLHNRDIDMDSGEILFRDTSHGFLSWALGTIIATVLLASVVSAIIATGTNMTTSMIMSGPVTSTSAAISNNPVNMLVNNPALYLSNDLFRAEGVPPSAIDAGTRNEATQILAAGLIEGNISDTDKTYLSQLVATNTGLSANESTQRVNSVITQLTAASNEFKQAVDTARESTMSFSLYTFLALIIGAVIAGSAAVVGGKHRDR